MKAYKVKASFDIVFKTKSYFHAAMAFSDAINSVDAVITSDNKVFEDWEVKNANVEIQEESSELGDERMREEN